MTEGSSLKKFSPTRLIKPVPNDLGRLKSDFNLSESTKNKKFILYLGNKFVTL